MSRTIRYINHGEPLTPEVANRAVKDVVEWLNVLDNRISGYTDVSNNILYDQPLAESTFVGCAVYYNTNTGLFAPARASVFVDNGTLLLDPCGYVLGLVIRKSSAHSGDILLSGVAEIDIRNADNFYKLPPGIRYLSVNFAGQLEQQMPPVSIPVCFVLRTNQETKKSLVAVAISLDNFLAGHKHYKFKIDTVPAGDYYESDRVIQNPNDTLPGWLPADNSVFVGLNVPVEAKFGYNINRSSLKRWWPPAVLNTFTLHWQTASTEDVTPVMGEVPPELYKVNYDGIWWLTDDPYLLPWYRGTRYNAGIPSGISLVPKVQQRMLAYFTQLLFNTHNAVVESLINFGVSNVLNKQADNLICLIEFYGIGFGSQAIGVVESFHQNNLAVPLSGSWPFFYFNISKIVAFKDEYFRLALNFPSGKKGQVISFCISVYHVDNPVASTIIQSPVPDRPWGNISSGIPYLFGEPVCTQIELTGAGESNVTVAPSQSTNAV